MFRKQDFKKIDLLGSGKIRDMFIPILGKKNTKIYKAEHIPTGKYYAIKEVEAKTLDKLNEYKVIFIICFLNTDITDRKKQFNCSKCRITQMFSSSMVTISMKPCTIHSE
jgi:hypothetical protein